MRIIGPLQPATFLWPALGPAKPLLAGPHRSGTAWATLESFREAEVNLAVLERAPVDCSESIAELLIRPQDFVQVKASRGEGLDRLPAALQENLQLTALDRDGLYADIHRLATLFLDLTGAGTFELRLERVENDSCRLFHVDRICARLLCTYHGLGTEWLREEHTNRKGLGKSDNKKVLVNGAPVQRLRTGWVGMLKGERKNFGRGIVHRSPSIAGSGPRIVLRIDSADRN